MNMHDLDLTWPNPKYPKLVWPELTNLTWPDTTLPFRDLPDLILFNLAWSKVSKI